MMFRSAAFPSPSSLVYQCFPIMTLMLALDDDPGPRARSPLLLGDARRCRPARSRRYAQNVPIVRDAEIEALVRDYARPIFKAAGLSKSGIDIILVNDRRFNAFVAGRRMFINTGALLHGGNAERDHRRASPTRPATSPAATSSACASSWRAPRPWRSSPRCSASAPWLRAPPPTPADSARPAPASLAGGSEVARRGLLGYQRTEEATADRSAITYLEATGQSAKGMLKTFQRFQSALSLSGTQVDPYQISHPMPRDRIANLEKLAKASPYFDDVDPPALQLRHDMMRAKIAVYTQGQAAASRLFRKDAGQPRRRNMAMRMATLPVRQS